MDDRVKEQISALVDGELPEAECRLLLARLGREPELRRTWERYLLAGEVLRNQAAPFYDPGFSRRVMEAVEALEPPTATPAPTGAAPTRTPAWVRTLASLAIAAGVATLAVLFFQPGRTGSGGRLAAPAPVAQGGARLDYAASHTPAPPSDELVERLSQYVVNHNEFAARTGLPHLARQVSAVEAEPVEVK
ncbi:MAG: hypothetical protein D6721_10430 [Gammaproteobacteria bacterium]|nr:MAG: hypothetical protein D6721_10430 [Gammaproteobacteria bacterium]